MSVHNFKERRVAPSDVQKHCVMVSESNNPICAHVKDDNECLIYYNKQTFVYVCTMLHCSVAFGRVRILL